ncbi:hypothetical protein BN2537_12053 [Streptomyces venezuelae]|nr:hypothetical protein BN2537_12053 [Streptomyces venezuelae]
MPGRGPGAARDDPDRSGRIATHRRRPAVSSQDPHFRAYLSPHRAA